MKKLIIMDSQEIIGIECKDCSYRSFPKRSFCPSCRSKNLKDWKVPLEGAIYSYTIVHFPIDKYEDAPYYVGLISVNQEKKPLLTAKLAFKNEKDLQIGVKTYLSVLKNFGPYQRNILVATIG